MKNKKLFIGLIILIAVIIAGVFFSKTTYGNQSYVPAYSNCQLAPATTTTTTLNPNGSTTLTCDAYNMDTNNPQGTIIDSAVLAIQLTSSTTNTVLTANLTYSQDGVDWYENNLVASSTEPDARNITTAQSIILNGNTTASTTRKAISIQTPMRYVRATFTGTVATSTIWAAVIPQKEVK